MARVITWKNDDNATCKLTIQDGSNTEVALTPAAEPFTTAMQESDDLFTPLRTSSGYARVVVDSVVFTGGCNVQLVRFSESATTLSTAKATDNAATNGFRLFFFGGLRRLSLFSDIVFLL